MLTTFKRTSPPRDTAPLTGGLSKRKAQAILFAEAISEVTVRTARVLKPKAAGFIGVYADSPFRQGATAVPFPAVALDQVTAHFGD